MMICRSDKFDYLGLKQGKVCMQKRGSAWPVYVDACKYIDVTRNVVFVLSVDQGVEVTRGSRFNCAADVVQDALDELIGVAPVLADL